MARRPVKWPWLWPRHQDGSSAGTQKFKGGAKGVEMNSQFLTPIRRSPKDNLNIVLDAGWISKKELCQGVKAGSVKVCS